ncbi:PH domain-containing protein [Salinactinospora qingdaonensis]|uniref:PH domain-containing protein n=1 Tax=Salinactinospora qingdaonensis TaxID=702744 RepID=A0ABP7F450_9ACTN
MSSDAEQQPQPPPPEPERRLSPLTLLTAPIRPLRSLLVPILIALVAGNFNPWVLGSSALAVVAVVVTGFVTYRTFRYRVGQERLEIRKGLLQRSTRTIPLERIRGVEVTSTLLHRAFGLAVVNIEAAAGGPDAQEGKLDAVSVDEAERLRRELLHRRALLRGESQQAASGEAEEEERTDTAALAPPSAVEPDTVYFAMPARWYFYAVLSLGYLLTPFVALAAVLGFVLQIVDDLSLDIESEQLFGAADELLADSVLPLIVAGVAVIVVLVLMMPVFAVISYSISHWDFTLLRRGEALVAERGLFTRSSVTLEHRRIRGHELLDNPLQRLRSAVRLRAIVTGISGTSNRAALLPIGDRDTVERIVAQALQPYRGPLHAHPPAARTRRLVRAIVPFAALAAAVAWFAPWWVTAVLLIPALLGIPLGIDRYRSLGHGSDSDSVSVRSGSLRRHQAVVHRRAVIGWRWRQTLFQRRVRLADMGLTVGAGDGVYEAIDADLAGSVAFAAEVTPAMVRPFLVDDSDHEST